jgi:hypothetical protein
MICREDKENQEKTDCTGGLLTINSFIEGTIEKSIFNIKLMN